MERDEELYTAATMLDGYLKVNRESIDPATQESMYIAIRELIDNISEPYKKEKANVIRVLISTKEDWKRFRKREQGRWKLFNFLKIIDDKAFYSALIKRIVEDEKTEEKIEKRLETEYTKKELQLMKEAMEEAARDGYPVTNQPVFF